MCDIVSALTHIMMRSNGELLGVVEVASLAFMQKKFTDPLQFGSGVPVNREEHDLAHR